MLQALFDYSLSAGYVSKVAKKLDAEVRRLYDRPCGLLNRQAAGVPLLFGFLWQDGCAGGVCARKVPWELLRRSRLGILRSDAGAMEVSLSEHDPLVDGEPGVDDVGGCFLDDRQELCDWWLLDFEGS